MVAVLLTSLIIFFMGVHLGMEELRKIIHPESLHRPGLVLEVALMSELFALFISNLSGKRVWERPKTRKA